MALFAKCETVDYKDASSLCEVLFLENIWRKAVRRACLMTIKLAFFHVFPEDVWWTIGALLMPRHVFSDIRRSTHGGFMIRSSYVPTVNPLPAALA